MKTERTRETRRTNETSNAPIPALSRRAGPLIVLGVLLALIGQRNPAEAGIVSTSGQVIEIATPLSVEDGQLVNDTTFFVFEESSNLVLTLDLPVDIVARGVYSSPSALTPGVIPAGTTVWSYFVHADPTAAYWPFLGGIEFDEDILGVVVLDSTLDVSDNRVGLPAVAYPTLLEERGLELRSFFGDYLTVGDRILTVDMLWAGPPLDQFRVITGRPKRGITFSFDSQGPSRSIADAFYGNPMSEGDILTVGDPGPPGPNRPRSAPVGVPGIMIEETALSLIAGMYGYTEVDAISYGRDQGTRVVFSVDEWTSGTFGPIVPSVRTEGAMGAQEASADIFNYAGPCAVPPWSAMLGNRVRLDGNAVSPPVPAVPGMGLQEPNPYAPTVPDCGDNLDALDLMTSTMDVQGPIFFSLDACFDDPTETGPPPPNTCTSAANSVTGGDVLMVMPGSGVPPIVYAYANQLGLGIVGPDDLDALILYDDGDGVFEPPQGGDREGPKTLTPGDDGILFSVRRGSAVIGSLDSRFNRPIAEADILGPPVGGGMLPSIFIPGHAMRLWTSRAATPPPTQYFDDINALDLYDPIDPPEAGPDISFVQPGGSVIIDVLGNDAGIGGELVPSSVVIFRAPEFGTVTSVDTVTGAIHYLHDGFAGSWDTLSYVVGDDNGEFSDPTPVMITIQTETSIPGGDSERTPSLLLPPQPNPFSGSTTLSFCPARAGVARADVFDLSGRLVRTLSDGEIAAGRTQSVTWDGRDSTGREVPSGTYFIRLTTSDDVRHVRIVKLR